MTDLEREYGPFPSPGRVPHEDVFSPSDVSDSMTDFEREYGPFPSPGQDLFDDESFSLKPLWVVALLGSFALLLFVLHAIGVELLVAAFIAFIVVFVASITIMILSSIEPWKAVLVVVLELVIGLMSC